jgi:hypothetical protein
MELQKKIYNFILDYWKLIKAWTPRPDDNDLDKWEKILEDVDKVNKKYMDGSKEYEFFKRLLLTWLEYMGKDSYGKRKEM